MKKTLLAACGLLLATTVHAQENPPTNTPSLSATAPILLQIEAGTHQVLTSPQALARVAVGDASVAEVTVLGKREVLITAKKTGLTSLLVWPKAQKDEAVVPWSYRLRIQAIQDPVPPPLTPPLPPALKKAQVLPGRVSGQVSSLPAQRLATQLAKGGNPDQKVIDTSTVAVSTQVLTQVRIAEVQRTTLQQYGLNVFKTEAGSLRGLSTPGTAQIASGQALQPGTPFSPLVSASGFAPLQNAFNLLLGNPARGLLSVLSVLESNGMAKTLAEPSLLATSGQTASYLVGGQFPVPINQGGVTGAISIEYKEFGVRLSLTPTVLSNQRIALRVAPEVSDLDTTTGVTVGGVSVPALLIRRTDTMIELGDGESFVISGLVSDSLLDNVDKVPYLSDIPILGAFFKSAASRRREKELIMIVTPRLVKPIPVRTRTPPLPGQPLGQSMGQGRGFGRLLSPDFGVSP
jgi:pilus assembly protein CpaC